ncbi:hypothetical protein F1D05_18460 [Kribbella qitaiheensis]|uniref:Uncharacterized protein n=1 Tax=Kribbella qitaiheensis TaxID=1544730 RepID=A0A7G6WZX0_9ACTN|nr:hypothetical protein [Kribbella qitaiheensis]QNE19535.1 hypothetical protein F1D05_18460 [Kribbella qitaiheensis]
MGEIAVERRTVEWVSNPRDPESALSWQLERVGSAAWQEWSLKFQRMAFGYAQDSGWHDPTDALSWLDHHALLHEGAVPRGALVWYQAADRIRVACSLGSGQVVGPLPTGQVGVAELSALSTDYVWSDAHFPFAH